MTENGTKEPRLREIDLLEGMSYAHPEDQLAGNVLSEAW